MGTVRVQGCTQTAVVPTAVGPTVVGPIVINKLLEAMKDRERSYWKQ